MINEIINRLEADIFFFDSNIGIAPNIKIGLEIAKEIVQEVANEYGKDTNVRSKDEVANEHRKLNRCDTCNHYIADEVPPICYFCCKGIEDNYEQKVE